MPAISATTPSAIVVVPCSVCSGVELATPPSAVLPQREPRFAGLGVLVVVDVGVLVCSVTVPPVPDVPLAAARWCRSGAVRPTVRARPARARPLRPAGTPPMGRGREVGVQGVQAITARMAAIESAIATVSAARTPTATGATSTPSATGTAFAAALAAEVRTAETRTAGVRTTGATATGALPAVDGFTPEQVGNASAVVAAGRGMGLSLRDQAIGVMTAIGESSLRVVDHGDTAGPDSRGLFQQRDNGAWGTYAERMDPTASAQSFFRALQRVDGRDAMAPTLVAHAVQRNADPQHYARSWDSAVALVARLTGTTPAQVAG